MRNSKRRLEWRSTWGRFEDVEGKQSTTQKRKIQVHAATEDLGKVPSDASIGSTYGFKKARGETLEKI